MAENKRLKRRLVVRAALLSTLFPKLSSTAKKNKPLPIMGNAPIQKAVARPTRPFDRNSSSRQSRRGSIRTSKKTSVLVQLIARRDWQKVLIRASLFPAEIGQKQTLQWYGIDWKVLPLHLACVLEPPTMVIQKLLTEQTACTTMTKNRLTGMKRRLFARRKAKSMLQESNTAKTEEASNYSSECGEVLNSSNISKENSSSVLSGSNLESSSTAPGKVPKRSRMEWNLSPLLNEADCLLPIHLACLYRASPAVIQHILEAYPEGAKILAMGGMLPIHMLCAGFEIPPPIAAPTDYMVLTQDWRLADALQHLVHAYPEGKSYISRNNGMTPLEYIDETMEDGINKILCLRIVKGEEEEEEEDHLQMLEEAESIITEEDAADLIPSEIVCDEAPSLFGDYETVQSEDVKVLSRNPLYSFMLAQDWESAYDMIEDEPERVHQWQYGIEIDRLDSQEPQLWKRLPIHNACRFGAPIALLSIMLRHNPSLPADPYTGAFPIHLACRYAPSMETVQVLLYADPPCVRQLDNAGRLPIHFACLNRAPTPVIQALIKAYPASVAIKDKSDKTPLDYCSGKYTDVEIMRTMKKLQQVLTRVEMRKIQDKEKLYTKPSRSPLGLEISTEDTGSQERLITEVEEDPEALTIP